MQQIFLGHVADPAAQLVVLGVDVTAGIADTTGVRGTEPGDGAQQGRLSRTTRADHSKQAARRQPETDIMQQLLAADRHRQSLRLEGGIPFVDGLYQRVASQLEQVVSDRDHIAFFQGFLSHPPSIEERAVGRPDIDDLDPGVADVQFSVASGDEQVGHGDVVVRAASDRRCAVEQLVDVVALVLELGPARCILRLGRRRRFDHGFSRSPESSPREFRTHLAFRGHLARVHARGCRAAASPARPWVPPRTGPGRRPPPLGRWVRRAGSWFGHGPSW